MQSITHYRNTQFESLLLLLSFLATAHVASGQKSISSKYPGDKGIESDRSVVFVENFDVESVDVLVKRWESIQSKKSLALSADVPKAVGQGRSLQLTHIGGEDNSISLYRRLSPGYDKLFVRFYVKFDGDCFPIHHFFHVGGYQPATAWPQGGAGHRPRGDERFSVGIEPHGRLWTWDYYAYWMEMRGSPPRGQTWGNSFIRDPKLKVARDKWICMEVMIKMNDVGASNGELALWHNGQQVSKLRKGYPKGKWVFDKFIPEQGGEGLRWNDAKRKAESTKFPRGGVPFDGFRWRKDKRLNVNFLWVLLYITKAPDGHVSRVWFDNIVVAKEYIGPIQTLRE